MDDLTDPEIRKAAKLQTEMCRGCTTALAAPENQADWFEVPVLEIQGGRHRKAGRAQAGASCDLFDYLV